jgi:NADH:ubiquinone oxidoreductase subunit 2 (subunit N)
MFTLGIIYTFIYILIVISLLIISSLALPFNILTEHSINFFSILLQKYTKFKLTFYLLIFTLTGLPPVGLFFIKFNIFVYILYQTHFILVITLFLIFFCNMLYYIQLFNIKNFKKNVYSSIYRTIIKNWYSMQLISLDNNYTTYTFIYLVTILIIVLTLGVFFYSDLFTIFNL